jgi:hypothetical protein
MIKYLISLWHAVNRRHDMSILWPICRDTARDLDQAKCAFYYHVSSDDAWTSHYTKDELYNYVDKLT